MKDNYNLKYNEDDRAQRYFLNFSEMKGQINISRVNSTNHVVAWHKHKIQTDYWFCVKGSFKVGLVYDDKRVEFHYLSDKYPKVLKIPPGVWHGYKALEKESVMMYYLTEKYDTNDEWKVKPGSFNETWYTEDK